MILASDSISAPARLRPTHDITSFDCGEPTLDDWLRRRALQNEQRGASRTYVVCVANRVIGYYALATGAITHEYAPGRIKRNMPEPIPVMVLGRLAVCREYQGRGIASALLRDAILRTVQVSEIAGIRAVLVHAISDRAKAFYEKSGFTASEIDPMTLMISLKDAVASIV